MKIQKYVIDILENSQNWKRLMINIMNISVNLKLMGSRAGFDFGIIDGSTDIATEFEKINKSNNSFKETFQNFCLITIMLNTMILL